MHWARNVEDAIAGINSQGCGTVTKRALKETWALNSILVCGRVCVLT